MRQRLSTPKKREQFGAPIAQLQAIQFKIEEMATKARAARFLVYSAAELKENHEPYGMESAMAKKYASDVCLEIVNEAFYRFSEAADILKVWKLSAHTEMQKSVPFMKVPMKFKMWSLPPIFWGKRQRPRLRLQKQRKRQQSRGSTKSRMFTKKRSL